MKRTTRIGVVTILALVVAAPTFGKPLRIWRDCSSSMSEQAVTALVAVVSRFLTEALDIDYVEIVRFSCADESLDSAQPEIFDLRENVTPNVDQRDVGLARYFTQGQKELERQEHDARVAYQKELEAKRNPTIARVAAAMSQPPRGAATCTQFDELALRISEESPEYNLIATDGWVDCRQIPQTPGRRTTRIVIALLPRKQGSSIAMLKQNERQMALFFPSARIARIYGVGNALREMVQGTTGDQLASLGSK